MENHIRMDDLGVPLFSETSIYYSFSSCTDRSQKKKHVWKIGFRREKKAQSSENKIRKQVILPWFWCFLRSLLLFVFKIIFCLAFWDACEAMIIRLSYVFFFVRPSLGFLKWQLGGCWFSTSATALPQCRELLRWNTVTNPPNRKDLWNHPRHLCERKRRRVDDWSMIQ